MAEKLVNTILKLGSNTILDEALANLNVMSYMGGAVNGSDFNSSIYNKTGFWRLGGTGLYLNGPNGTRTHYGVLVVIYYEGWSTQIVFTQQNSFTRTSIDSRWKEWMLIT